jgi:hypothetical protein
MALSVGQQIEDADKGQRGEKVEEPPRAHQRSTSATGEREGLAQNVGQRLRQPTFAARGVMTRGIMRQFRKNRWP